VKGAFERLEPRAVKVASAVLRGLGGSNAPRLPDQPTTTRAAFNSVDLLSSVLGRLTRLVFNDAGGCG
jgi:hypothetical protein